MCFVLFTPSHIHQTLCKTVPTQTPWLRYQFLDDTFLMPILHNPKRILHYGTITHLKERSCSKTWEQLETLFSLHGLKRRNWWTIWTVLDYTPDSTWPLWQSATVSVLKSSNPGPDINPPRQLQVYFPPFTFQSVSVQIWYRMTGCFMILLYDTRYSILWYSILNTTILDTQYYGTRRVTGGMKWKGQT